MIETQRIFAVVLYLSGVMLVYLSVRFFFSGCG